MITNNRWGLGRENLRKLAYLHNKTFEPPHKTDHPDHCVLGESYWNNHPIKNYNYQYNSWGFRGEDYEQYTGQIVNICIGDSTTMNIGGPIEHSWPYLLSQYFDIPTLNYGIDSLSFTDFLAYYNKAKTFFKIDKVFVLYNIFENNIEAVDLLIGPVLQSLEIDTKINVLKKYSWVHGAYWQFNPPWMFFNDELPALYEHFPEAHNYLKTIDNDLTGVDINLLFKVDQLKFEYDKIAGHSWLSYEKFCENFLLGINVLNFVKNPVDRQLLTEYLSGWFIPLVKRILLANRDGMHLSLTANQALADYFYQQTLKGH